MLDNINKESETLLLKLCVAGIIRLVEVEKPPTMAIVRELLKEKFGKNASEGELFYSLPNDDDKILVLNDADLELAASLRSWGGQPLKLTATVEEVVESATEKWGANKDVFEQSVATLECFGHHGVEPEQLKRLLSALDFSPRRLVKSGLAHPKSLKLHQQKPGGINANEEDRKDDDGDEDAYDSWEKVRDMRLDDAEPHATPVGAPVLMSIDDDPEKLVAKLVDDELPAGPNLEGEEDAIVTALRGKGITLQATTIHALLRVLNVMPKRFVKLGLIKDVKVAREAYTRGADLERQHMRAHGVPKSGKGGHVMRNAIKGWGRGNGGRWAHQRGRGCGAKGHDDDHDGPGKSGHPWGSKGKVKGERWGCKGKGKGNCWGRHEHHEHQPPHHHAQHHAPPPPPYHNSGYDDSADY